MESCWDSEVEALVATKQPKKYDLAVQHLVDLRDVAARQGNEAKRTFTERLRGNGL